MDRKEWLAERMKGIGASEAAAVLGISPWSSPMDVWARKRGLIPEIEDNERLRTGRLFEEPIAQLYAEREHVKVTGGGYDLRFHPVLPVFATPDRLVVGQPRGLEIKTVEPSMSHEWGDEGSDQIPPHYVSQVAVCMAVTGLPEWDAAAFFGMNDLRVYRLRRDLELEEALLSRLTEFWTRYVVAGEEPELDGSRGCAEYLATKYPRNVRPLLGATPEQEKLLSDLFAIREQLKADDAINTEYENKIKAIIGEAEGIQAICGKVTWKVTADSKKIDWEKVATELMSRFATIEDLEKAKVLFTTVRPGSRRFLPTPKR